MNPSDLKKGIRDRLHELADKRKAIEAEESALQKAFDALGGKAAPPGKRMGGHTGTARKFRGRVRRVERERQMAALFSREPERVFKPVDFEEFGVPGSTADAIMRDWIEAGRLTQTGTTPRGAPMAKAAGSDESPVGTEADGTEPVGPEPPVPPPEPEKPQAPERRAPTAASKASAERRKAEAEERRRTERMRIVNLLSSHPEGLILKEIAERLGVDQPRLTLLMKGMEGSVETEATRRNGNAVKLVKLKRRGSGPREAVTAPGDGTREGRLR